jgi:hypothetical protein
MSASWEFDTVSGIGPRNLLAIIWVSTCDEAWTIAGEGSAEIDALAESLAD